MSTVSLAAPPLASRLRSVEHLLEPRVSAGLSIEHLERFIIALILLKDASRALHPAAGERVVKEGATEVVHLALNRCVSSHRRCGSTGGSTRSAVAGGNHSWQEAVGERKAAGGS